MFQEIKPCQTPSGEVMIYEYGIRLDRPCLEHVDSQIAQARQLYNNVVASVRDIVTELQAFILEHAGDEARGVQAEIDVLNEQFAVAKAEDDEDAMKVIAQSRRLKWRELGDKIKATRKEHRAEIQERYLSRIGRNSACDTYKIRSEAVANGLGWATANAVLDSALIAWKKSFMLGRAPRFAIGSLKDQDTLTLQFTAAGGVPINTLLEGGHGELSMRPTQGCGRRKYGELQFRLGAAKADIYATGTWQYHRPLPEGASAGLARLVRRRIGKDTRWALQIMVKLKRVDEVSVLNRKPLVSVHFGWAADVSGRRVAGIAEAADPESARILQLPQDIERTLDRASLIQSERDLARDDLVPKVKEIVLDEAPEHIADELQAIRRLPVQHVAISRLHRLCYLLRDADVLPEWMEVWRKEDRIRLQSATHMARSARNARCNFYRNEAARLAREYSAISIEPLDLATAAKKVDEVTGKKSEFAKKARSGRVVAAISEFESAIRWAAAKNGAALFEVSAETAATCGICGGHTEPSQDDHQTIKCQDCGAEIDRKKNGAATAWQAVADEIEVLVTRYWIERKAMMDAAASSKTEKLVKMADGRRKARTTMEAEKV